MLCHVAFVVHRGMTCTIDIVYSDRARFWECVVLVVRHRGSSLEVVWRQEEVCSSRSVAVGICV